MIRVRGVKVYWARVREIETLSVEFAMPAKEIKMELNNKLDVDW